jgi:hypothetical protein
MDVRIGTIEATIVDTGAGDDGDAQTERIARRVFALVERRRIFDERSTSDRDVSSPDGDDIESYG